MARGVVITGASTGIGHACAKRLSEDGFKVFAGVRKDEDAARLAGELGDRVVPLKLDVTDQDAIASAARSVEEQLAGEPLTGVVNNAGIGVFCPLESIDLDVLRRQLEVNAVAPVAVAQAFLPQIRRAKGRVVNISSIGGLVAQPFVGAYSMSKFALEAMNDALRRELSPWGIHVVAIEPGTIKTPIWDKGLDKADETLESLGEDGRGLYGERIEKMRRFVPKLVKRGAEPSKVADAVSRALTADRPRTRYLVGDAKALVATDRVLPARAVDSLLARFY